MNKCYTLLLSCFGLNSFLNGQVVINNTTFPVAGDSFVISTGFDSTLRLSPPSPLAQTWDLSRIYTQSLRTERIESAANGVNFQDFPNTEILLPLVQGFVGTAYTDVSTTQMNKVGGGIEFAGFGLTAPYADPHLLRVVPLSLGSNRNDNFEISFGESIDSIPFLRTLIDTLAAGQLPGGISPDSIRIRLSGTRNMYADGHGTCILYDGSYQVLRQKITERTNTKIEVSVRPPFPGSSSLWFDITPLLTSQLPFPLPLADTTVYYDFLANNYRQPIARFNLNNNGTVIESIEFKGEHPAPVSVLQTRAQNTQIVAYPNPANARLNIGFENYEPGNYRVELVDVQGKKVLVEEKVQAFPHSLAVEQYNRGLYWLVVYDTKNAPAYARLIKLE